MLAVVLAAGRGTRLAPLTAERSKATLPIAGRPMIERVLDMLERGGVERLIIVAHPGDRDLVKALNQSRWAQQIQLTYQEQRLGMAHALQAAAPLVRQEAVSDFLLASCDSLYPNGHVASLIKHHREEGLDATLTLMWTSRHEATPSAIVIRRDGLITDIIEKPSPDEIPQGQSRRALSAPSLYALSAEILRHLALVRPSVRGEYEFPDALRLLMADGGAVGGVPVEERMTLTEPGDLLAINRHFLRHDPSSTVIEAELPSDVTIRPPVRVEDGIRLDSGCEIGPEVYLESGCRIFEGASVRRAVVLRGGAVEANQIVDGAVISSSR